MHLFKMHSVEEKKLVIGNGTTKFLDSACGNAKLDACKFLLNYM